MQETKEEVGMGMGWESGGGSAIEGGILDRAIDAENAVHNDFLRLVSG